MKRKLLYDLRLFYQIIDVKYKRDHTGETSAVWSFFDRKDSLFRKKIFKRVFL